MASASVDALPPNGQEALPSAAYTDLVDVLAHATKKFNTECLDDPQGSRFLSGPKSHPTQRMWPFFSDLHHEISRSWNQPFSTCLTNMATADITNLVGSVEQGYATSLVIEDTLVSHLLLSSAPSLKSRPLLPTKPCRTTSALIGKSYMAAGQAGMALHGRGRWGLTPEAVQELHRVTDLALHATKPPLTKSHRNT